MQSLKRLNDNRKLTSESGFSLLELVVSMVIFIVVSASVWGVLRAAQMSRSVVSEQSGIQKNVRLALNLMGRDTYNAGYGYPLKNTVVLPDNRISVRLGIPNDTDTTRDTVPPVIAGNNITLSTFSTVANTRTDQITLFFKDSTFNVVGSGSAAVSQPLNINAATTTSGIDEIVPLSGTNAACRVNDIYLITGNSGSTIGLATGLNGSNAVQFGTVGDTLVFNQPGSTGPLRAITTPASMIRVNMVTYFVTADGILTRREFANTPGAVEFVDEPLVYGVEDFQVQYVMDSGALSDNPSAGPDNIAGTADDTQSNLAAVRQIRYTVTVRSIEKNSTNQVYKETMTSTFSTRNLGYDAN